MQLSFTGKKNIRKNFGKLKESLSIPNLIEVQKNYKWGSKFLENLSQDLSKAFPNVKGFSYRNLKFIRQWVSFWDNEKGKQIVSQIYQIPWGIM